MNNQHCPHGVYWHACGDPKCAMQDITVDRHIPYYPLQMVDVKDWINENCIHGKKWYACLHCIAQSECLDEEGYPTTHAFNLIEKWDFHHTDKLFEFIRQLWRWNKYMWKQTDDGEKITYDISTGGWSGNEYLLSVLERNFVVWQFTWVQTRRGGHYIFELPYKEQPSLMGGISSNNTL
jgi:hypothetical protein